MIGVPGQTDILDIDPIYTINWLLWLTLLGLIVLIISLLLLFPKIKQLYKSLKEKSFKRQSPYVELISSLNELKKQKFVESKDLKPFYTSLSFITKRYLSRRFDFNALDLTTSEIQVALRNINEVESEHLNKICKMFQNADIAKFTDLSLSNKVADLDIKLILSIAENYKNKQAEEGIRE